MPLYFTPESNCGSEVYFNALMFRRFRPELRDLIQIYRRILLYCLNRSYYAPCKVNVNEGDLFDVFSSLLFQNFVVVCLRLNSLYVSCSGSVSAELLAAAQTDAHRERGETKGGERRAVGRSGGRAEEEG